MNNSKVKRTPNTPTSNNNNNFPSFLNKNYKSPSTEKLYTAVTKSKTNKDLKKSPSLKIASQYEQANRQININFFENQQINISSKLNQNNPMIKNSSVNNFFNSMTVENDNNNKNLQSQAKVANEPKYKITQNEYLDIENKRNDSLKKDNLIKKESEKNTKQINVENCIVMIKERDKEIEKLKQELLNTKKRIDDKKLIINNDVKLNNNLNINGNSLSTSNKRNTKSIFNFDTKTSAKQMELIPDKTQKVEVFSNRSPSIKNMNNFNNFSNNFQNVNLTNRNSQNSKHFSDILDGNFSTKQNKQNSFNKSGKNFSKSPNFKYTGKNTPGNKTSKNFSSTFSNFFRKNNKENSGSSLTKDETARRIQLGNNNSTLNYNSNCLSTNKSKNTPMNSHRVHNSVTFKLGNQGLKENSDNLINFSENVKLDPNHSLNFLKKNTDNLSREMSSNDLNKKKNSSKLEIKDLENNENDFKKSKIWDNKSYSVRNREEIDRKKSLISLYSYSNQNYQFSYSEKNNDNTNSEVSNRDDLSNCINSNEDNNKSRFSYNIVDQLQNLKNRTQGVLENYAKNLNALKSKGTI